MRMSEWTPEVIRFMEDAERFTSYFHHLAAIVRDHAAPGTRLADVGCGMGQLAFELAEYGHTVDAIDTSPRAIGYVGRRAKESRRGSVNPILCDMNAHEAAQPYEAMAFCLSASIDDALRIGAAQCSGTIVVVNKIQAKMDTQRERSGSASFKRDKRPLVYNFEETLVSLARQGLCLEGRELSIDYGQPFRSLEDAQEYYALFRTRSYPDGVSLGELEKLLDATDDAEFPYYLPVRRHLAAYIIDADAARASLARGD